ncbi:hypothetical protein A5631_07630 [Mycolicibacter heraklionensis]|nr:hypothetical protein A5631_07630 [Mycolicibacter heraklionensis]
MQATLTTVTARTPGTTSSPIRVLGVAVETIEAGTTQAPGTALPGGPIATVGGGGAATTVTTSTTDTGVAAGATVLPGIPGRVLGGAVRAIGPGCTVATIAGVTTDPASTVSTLDRAGTPGTAGTTSTAIATTGALRARVITVSAVEAVTAPATQTTGTTITGRGLRGAVSL